jgi:ribose 5-phosphate isomerase B
MRLLITSDHAGYELRKHLYAYLKDAKIDVTDAGPYENDPQDDYPDFVAPVALEVSQDPQGVRAIVIGGSGQGEAIMANRFPRVRAVVFNGQYKSSERTVPDEISLSRLHNDANILALGARFISVEDAKKAVDGWLATPFSGDVRHIRRIEKIETLSPLADPKHDETGAESRSAIVHEF